MKQSPRSFGPARVVLAVALFLGLASCQLSTATSSHGKHTRNLLVNTIGVIVSITSFVVLISIYHPTTTTAPTADSTNGITAAANNCSTARTCSECISISRQCRWCGYDRLQANVPRCGLHFAAIVCPPSQLINPASRPMQILQDRPFSDSIQDSVQLKPQKIEQVFFSKNYF